jgi:hypothetical protein
MEVAFETVLVEIFFSVLPNVLETVPAPLLLDSISWVTLREGTIDCEKDEAKELD